MWPGKSPPSGERWLREAVDVARKISTVWRTVATGGGGRRQENLHRRPMVATRCQAVVVARKISTVWRTVATGVR